MKKRSSAGGEPIKGRRQKAVTPKRTTALKPAPDRGLQEQLDHRTRELSEAGRGVANGFDWVGGATAFKIVLMEGIEVVFIVIAVGAGRGLLGVASAGALAACVVVAAVGAAVHRPLARVPENALKFVGQGYINLGQGGW